MSDPYERNKIPLSPAKPKLFSPFTPFKLALWSWFWVMDIVFRRAWSEMILSENNGDGDGVFGFVVYVLGNGLLIILPLGLIFGLAVGLSGLTIVGAIAATYATHLFLYFTFHLHDKDSRDLWKDKLL